MENEWVQARDGTEARRTDEGIEVRMIGKTDSTVYRVKKDNEPALKRDYPALFEEPAPVEPEVPKVAPRRKKK